MRRIREQVFGHYGRVCACCGEDRIEFLTLDHINGGGRQHRIALGVPGGYSFYARMKVLGYPQGLQTLCWNCNCAKHYFHQCPHQSEAKREVS